MNRKHILFILLLAGAGNLFAQAEDIIMPADLYNGHWLADHELPYLDLGDTVNLYPSTKRTSLTFKKSGTVVQRLFVGTYEGGVVRTGTLRGKWMLSFAADPLLVLDFPGSRIELRLLGWKEGCPGFVVEKKEEKNGSK